MELWIDILRGTLLVLSHTISLYLMSDPKSSIRHPLVFWISISAVLEIIICTLFAMQGYSFSSGGVAYLILLFIYLADYLYVSAGSIARNLFAVLMYMTFFMLSAAVADILASLFLDGSELATILIRTAFSAAFIILYPTKIRKPFHKATDDIERGWAMLVTVEAISFVVVSVISFMGAFFFQDQYVYLAVLSMVSLLILSSHAVVIMMLGLLNERNVLRSLQDQKDFFVNELDAEKELSDTSMRYRRDIKQHDRILLSFLEKGEYDKALSYLREYDASVDEGKARCCENSVVNALLGITSRKLDRLGGKLESKVSLPDDIPIPSVDIALVFGNLLENAYEASLGIKHPSIKVRAGVQNESIRAEIRNKMKGSVLWKDHIPLSTKAHGGSGVRNVNATLGKYDGMLSQSQEGNVFISRIIIPF